MGSGGCDIGFWEPQKTRNTQKDVLELFQTPHMIEEMDQTGEFLFKDETFRIRGAVFQVYRAMGAGFLEAVYQECLALEFARRAIPFEPMKPLPLTYMGVALRQTYVADFVCYGEIILELKAVRSVAPEHRAQTINYLRASNMKLGLLVNFGATPGVEIERFALQRASANSAFSAVPTLAEAPHPGG